ncbi:MAG: hypothetical protein ACI9U2_004417 [Bradymonadia bacterium]
MKAPGAVSAHPTLDLRDAARSLAPTLPVEPSDRAAAIATWRGRMVNEYGSARVFTALADQLVEADADAKWIDAARRMADEERRHGVLCGAVVEALGGEARAPALAEESMPIHADVDRFEAVTRNILSICCLSESVAVALIGAERLQMPEGGLRDVLTEIWSDEVGHARFGWRWLATHRDQLPAQSLGAYLRIAFAHLEAHELAHLPLGGAGDPAMGVCTGADGRALFYSAVSQVIIPRLESLGLPAADAWSTRHAA